MTAKFLQLLGVPGSVGRLPLGVVVVAGALVVGVPHVPLVTIAVLVNTLVETETLVRIVVSVCVTGTTV